MIWYNSVLRVWVAGTLDLYLSSYKQRNALLFRRFGGDLKCVQLFLHVHDNVLHDEVTIPYADDGESLLQNLVNVFGDYHLCIFNKHHGTTVFYIT